MIYMFLTDSKGYFDMNETKSNEENLAVCIFWVIVLFTVLMPKILSI